MIVPVKVFTIGLYLVTNLNCPITKVGNRTDTWTQEDHDQVKRSQVRCSQKYPVNSPCLVYFRKNATRNWWVLCGGENE